jgi:hypothetical protein
MELFFFSLWLGRVGDYELDYLSNTKNARKGQKKLCIQAEFSCPARTYGDRAGLGSKLLGTIINRLKQAWPDVL